MSDQSGTESTVEFTRDDILAIDFEAILSREPKDAPIIRNKARTCEAYEAFFTDEVKSSKLAKKRKDEIIFQWLAVLCSYYLTENRREPFRPKWPFDHQVYLPVSNLPDKVLGILLETVSELPDAELRARVADVLWIRRKGGYQVAELAR